MVLIDGIKYACQRCIRGHRVKSCIHTDAVLTAVRSKGRPTSQCHHCRENRKLKSLHISCNCNASNFKNGVNSVSKKTCNCNTGQACICYKGSRPKSSTTNSVTNSSPLTAYSDENSLFSLDSDQNASLLLSSSLPAVGNIYEGLLESSLEHHLFEQLPWDTNELFKFMEDQVPEKIGNYKDKMNNNPLHTIPQSNSNLPTSESMAHFEDTDLVPLPLNSFCPLPLNNLDNFDCDSVPNFFADDYLIPFVPEIDLMGAYSNTSGNNDKNANCTLSNHHEITASLSN
ncbi:copper-fist-domain-containing protein [Nadsonia fulvescens var. elongata DSM 6958]|uniref:Copper-fist-domain-containing protein n=1 Tax=Nadsonia fulvescens var. elongata DSM 6958 TaxID=857566 RepID=A0A1E3PPI8_9ASCO|nr:copper-fist-domain-containing protein [Nadsonia fulvescens var. elongata DSM 6958]